MTPKSFRFDPALDATRPLLVVQGFVDDSSSFGFCAVDGIPASTTMRVLSGHCDWLRTDWSFAALPHVYTGMVSPSVLEQPFLPEGLHEVFSRFFAAGTGKAWVHILPVSDTASIGGPPIPPGEWLLIGNALGVQLPPAFVARGGDKQVSVEESVISQYCVVADLFSLLVGSAIKSMMPGSTAQREYSVSDPSVMHD